MKNILAVSKLYVWRIVEIKNWYKLQSFNGLWWRTVSKTVSKTDSDGFIGGICNDWAHDLDLIWIDYI